MAITLYNYYFVTLFISEIICKHTEYNNNDNKNIQKKLKEKILFYNSDYGKTVYRNLTLWKQQHQPKKVYDHLTNEEKNKYAKGDFLLQDVSVPL